MTGDAIHHVHEADDHAVGQGVEIKARRQAGEGEGVGALGPGGAALAGVDEQGAAVIGLPDPVLDILAGGENERGPRLPDGEAGVGEEVGGLGLNCGHMGNKRE